MDDHGTDIKVLPDLAEDDAELATGLDCLGQDLALRLDTPRGSLISDPDYGLDLRSYLNSAQTPRQILEIIVNVKNELEKDDRVDACDVQASYSIQARVLTIKATVYTRTGPYLFTFLVNQDAVLLAEAT